MIARKPSQPRPTPAQLLAAKPVRLVSTELIHTDNGGGQIKIPLRQRPWPFRLPAGATKTFELDAIGVFVWTRLDGETTVKTLIEQLAEQYRLNLREAQVPMLKFLEILARKGLVALPNLNESPAGDVKSEVAP